MAWEQRCDAWGLYDMHGNVWEWCHDAAAENLRKYKGDLSFDLDNLPESAAAILRKHPSFVDED